MRKEQNTHGTDRRKRMAKTMEKIRSLRERGLLNEQKFVAPSRADFERAMLRKKPNIQNS